MSAERIKPKQTVQPKFLYRTKSWIIMIDITGEPFYMDTDRFASTLNMEQAKLCAIEKIT